MAISEYQRQAAEFLQASGTVMSINKIGTVDGFPFDSKDTRPHDKYIVVLRSNGKTYDFPFYDSAHNYYVNQDRVYCGQRAIKPTAYDILACLQSYPVEADVWDFANEFGYEIDSRESFNRVNEIHRECRKQYAALLDLFGEEWMEKLAEIQ